MIKWLLFEPLFQISINCTFLVNLHEFDVLSKARPGILTIRELKSSRFWPIEKTRSQFKRCFIKFERFWKWQKLQMPRVSAIIDIKQPQVLKKCRSKEKDVKPCLSLVLPRCSEAIGPAASMCWRNWSDMAAPMPGPMGRGLAKIAGLESFWFAFVKPKSHSSIHQPCQCSPCMGPAPASRQADSISLGSNEKKQKKDEKGVLEINLSSIRWDC